MTKNTSGHWFCKDKLGGIEIYVHDVAALLTQQGHTVDIIGSTWWRRKSSRILSMLFSACNVFFAGKLRKKIESFQPDIIWCHSVLRHIGRLGLSAINRSSAQKRMMYHDLGYFHPFPHAVTQEKQIPASLDWKDFSASIHNPITKFLVRGKWILLQKMQKQLKKFDKHLVPSAFMEALVRKNYGEKVTVLPHFIQE
jgi:glycosyltransferase involved in cell wall biosynthesis